MNKERLAARLRYVFKAPDDWPSTLDEMNDAVGQVLDFWTERKFLPGRGDLD